MGDRRCNVCFEDDANFKTSCGHWFHYENTDENSDVIDLTAEMPCLNEWLVQQHKKNTCPVCRRPLGVTDVDNANNVTVDGTFFDEEATDSDDATVDLESDDEEATDSDATVDLESDDEEEEADEGATVGLKGGDKTQNMLLGAIDVQAQRIAEAKEETDRLDRAGIGRDTLIKNFRNQALKSDLRELRELIVDFERTYGFRLEARRRGFNELKAGFDWIGNKTKKTKKVKANDQCVRLCMRNALDQFTGVRFSDFPARQNGKDCGKQCEKKK